MGLPKWLRVSAACGACLLGVASADLITGQLLRRPQRSVEYVRFHPEARARKARAEASDFRRNAASGQIAEVSPAAGQPATDPGVRLTDQPEWLPRSGRVAAVFTGSGAPSVLSSSDWAAPNLEPLATSPLPKSEVVKLRRRHKVQRSLCESRLSLMADLPEAPWTGARYQLLTTVSLSPSAMSVGRDFAPCASPELTLAWFEHEADIVVPSGVRELAVNYLASAATRRRELVSEILNVIREHAAGQGEADTPKVVYVRDGVLHVIGEGECPEVDAILTRIRDLRQSVLSQLEDLVG